MFREHDFTLPDGTRRATIAWTPQHPKGVGILLLHGYAEHARRYRNFGTRMSGEGWHVYAMDHAGHGKSPGTRGRVDSIETLALDARTYLHHLMHAHPDFRWFVFGHSMGGLVALHTVLPVQHAVAGLLLSGPLFRTPPTPGIVKALGRLVAAVAPALPAVPLDADAVSRDPDVVKRYKADPLNYTGKVRAGTGICFEDATRVVHGLFPEITLPLWIGAGGLDRLVPNDGARLLHERASSTDKTLKIYEGLYHEILNEPEGEVVLHDLVQWLKKRIA